MEDLPSPVSRKRKLEDSFANTPAKRAALTKRNLRAHTQMSSQSRKRRQNGPLADDIALQGGSESTTTVITKSSSTNTRSPDYGQRLLENGIIFGRVSAKPPRDVEEVKEYLFRPRQSGSPDRETWHAHTLIVEESTHEVGLVEAETGLHGLLQPPKPGGTYCAKRQVTWNRVGQSQVNRRNIGAAKPDYTESHKRELYPESVRDGLGGALEPSAVSFCVLPHFIMESKAAGDDIRLMTYQTAYEGAIVSHAGKLREEYLGHDLDQCYWGRTQAVTIAYNGYHAIIFLDHALRNDDDEVEYHHYALLEHTPLISLKTFRETYRHFRNAQEWGRMQANKHLKAFRDHDRDVAAALPSPPGSSLPPSIRHPQPPPAPPPGF